ncbi:FAD-binding oxidoreductase [Marinobacterium sedimentorum]|uniref:FAD-binding oxidoreductase n=1 Tax=Marinobacterium sedimentorum TaxID=2927804 RepID=UPI0020C6CACF|nr:FAD-binding oxidoreductase [Marinobacterium sedimentorum]MCP8690178.1 FAD-binding oxidoreductase [Marinobacterium sedimentorum]
MSTYRLTQIDGAAVELDASVVDRFAASLRGELITADSAHYDWARTIWNAMIDKRPGLIVRCVTPTDVRAAIDFARDNELLISVRGGGHNIAGNAVCEGGLMIDLAPMRWVRVDPAAATAWVGAGALLGDVDRETLAHGLVVPLGINSITGVAGLTLGGGFGWLSRRFGLAIDNLRSADVVATDGQLLRASKQQNPDLFWALRGGGGNFGIVTAFEFSLQRIWPEVMAGLIVYPLDQAREVLQQYREFAAQAPDNLTVWGVMRKAPPLPFLPEKVHGTEVLILALCYSGNPEDGNALIEPLRTLGTPVGEHVGRQSFVDWQTAFDPLLMPGARNYWKSHNLAALPDALIDILVEFCQRLPSDQTEIFIAQMGGATNRQAVDATAYPHRETEFIINVHGRWESAEDDERCIDWCRQLFDALVPHAMGGVYVNFMTADEQYRVGAAYGANHQRLARLKQQYDPDNLLRMNQNIPPVS